jgi:broad-specificity NMP kinase
MMSKSGKIVFVTGTSGTGKSTLAMELRKMKLGDVKVYDMDECGVPDDVDEKWRQDRTKELLQEAIENKKNGFSSIICGVSVPQEVKDSRGYHEDLGVIFGILEISEQAIVNRLNDRNWNKNLIKDNVIWASHLSEFVRKEKNKFSIDSEKNSSIQVAKLVLKEIGFGRGKGMEL